MSSRLWKVVQGRSLARWKEVLAGLRVEVRELWLRRVYITHRSCTVKIHAFFGEMGFKICAVKHLLIWCRSVNLPPEIAQQNRAQLQEVTLKKRVPVI